LNTFRHGFGMADTLGVDNDMMFLARLTACDDIVDQLLLVIIVFLRDQHVLGAVGDTAPHSQITGVAAHYLNDTAALMGSGSITHLVDRLHSRIHSRVKSDGVLCTGNVKVDGTGNSDGIDTQIGQLLRACERTVSTDDNQALDPVFPADFGSSLLSFRRAELRAPCSIQDRTASLDGIRYVFGSHIYDLFI